MPYRLTPKLVYILYSYTALAHVLPHLRFSLLGTPAHGSVLQSCAWKRQLGPADGDERPGTASINGLYPEAYAQRSRQEPHRLPHSLEKPANEQPPPPDLDGLNPELTN